MVFPDYTGGSIVNVAASFAKALGVRSSMSPARSLPAELLGERAVLVLVDGLGHDYLMARPWSFLAQHARAKVTSTLPSGTAAGSTALRTAEPPGQHGATGWYTYIPELKRSIKPLPYRTMHGDRPRAEYFSLFPYESVFDRSERRTAMVVPRSFLAQDPPSRLETASELVPYDDLDGFVKGLVSSDFEFAYAYWPWHDWHGHHRGLGHDETEREFQRFDDAIRRLSEELGATIVVTADHGMTDVQGIVRLGDHPRLRDCLARPLTGETRLAFCHVKPGREEEFEEYVEEHIPCRLWKSRDLIARGAFGPVRPGFEQRFGDYALEMESSIQDDERPLIGHHGGMSSAEMYVPLVVVKKK